MTYWRIVETDTFGGDYPDEKFVEPLPVLSKETLEKVCALLNDSRASRYYKVEKSDYKLQPGFEP